MAHVLAKELRDAVLQTAFQGKLTDQRDTDSSVFNLLKQIENEKTELYNVGKIEKQKKLPVIDNNSIPFDIPENWIWERWGNLSNSIQYGVNTGALGKGNARLVRISDIQNNQINWRTVPYCSVENKEIDHYLLRLY